MLGDGASKPNHTDQGASKKPTDQTPTKNPTEHGLTVGRHPGWDQCHHNTFADHLSKFERHAARGTIFECSVVGVEVTTTVNNARFGSMKFKSDTSTIARGSGLPDSDASGSVFEVVEDHSTSSAGTGASGNFERGPAASTAGGATAGEESDDEKIARLTAEIQRIRSKQTAESAKAPNKEHSKATSATGVPPLPQPGKPWSPKIVVNPPSSIPNAGKNPAPGPAHVPVDGANDADPESKRGDSSKHVRFDENADSDPQQRDADGLGRKGRRMEDEGGEGEPRTKRPKRRGKHNGDLGPLAWDAAAWNRHTMAKNGQQNDQQDGQQSSQQEPQASEPTEPPPPNPRKRPLDSESPSTPADTTPKRPKHTTTRGAADMPPPFTDSASPPDAHSPRGTKRPRTESITPPTTISPPPAFHKATSKRTQRHYSSACASPAGSRTRWSIVTDPHFRDAGSKDAYGDHELLVSATTTFPGGFKVSGRAAYHTRRPERVFLEKVEEYSDGVIPYPGAYGFEVVECTLPVGHPAWKEWRDQFAKRRRV